MTQGEWKELRENDPVWVATRERLKEEERRRQATEAVLLQHEAPLAQELRATGYDVQSAWDLFNRKQPWRKDVPIPPYGAAIPILIRHLQPSYHFRVREGIVRALTTRDAIVAFDHLVAEYRRTASSSTEDQAHAVELLYSTLASLWSREELERLTAAQWDGYRFALANAIGVIFRAEHIPTMLALVQDPRNGDSRACLVERLRQKMRRWKRADQAVLTVLDNLAHDSGEVGKEATKALQVLRP